MQKVLDETIESFEDLQEGRKMQIFKWNSVVRKAFTLPLGQEGQSEDQRD